MLVLTFSIVVYIAFGAKVTDLFPDNRCLVSRLLAEYIPQDEVVLYK